jgi:FYVE/RhoGEF/PH domain-containing protein 5/6
MKTGLSLAIDLPALLVLPVERLQQYKRGIENILKYTFKTHVDYAHLSHALQKISSALNKINDTKKFHDNEENLKRISKVLVGNVPDLKLPGRIFIREGTLVKLCRKIPKKRYFMLLSDILIYGSKEENSTKVKFHRLINLTEGSTIEDIPDSKNTTPNGFKLITSTKSFVVYAESAESKKSWVETFNQVLAKINGGKREKKGELAPVWINDNEALNCMLCEAQFTVLKRRVTTCLIFYI